MTYTSSYLSTSIDAIYTMVATEFYVPTYLYLIYTTSYAFLVTIYLIQLPDASMFELLSYQVRGLTNAATNTALPIEIIVLVSSMVLLHKAEVL